MHEHSIADPITPLKSLFSAYGEVESVKVAKDYSGRPKGFGFVEMPSNSEADQAIKALNGNHVDGNPIKARPADPGQTTQQTRLSQKEIMNIFIRPVRATIQMMNLPGCLCRTAVKERKTMAKQSQRNFKKRQKEIERQEKAKEKMERRQGKKDKTKKDNETEIPDQP